MQQIIEGLEDMIASYDDLDNPEVLVDQAAVILDSVRDDMQMSMAVTPDNIAFGIYPNVAVTERGLMFMRQCDIVVDELPSWQEVREQQFFQIKGETDFIRSLPEVDEETAVKILFAVAHAAVNHTPIQEGK